MLHPTRKTPTKIKTRRHQHTSELHFRTQKPWAYASVPAVFTNDFWIFSQHVVLHNAHTRAATPFKTITSTGAVESPGRSPFPSRPEAHPILSHTNQDLPITIPCCTKPGLPAVPSSP